MHRPKCCGFSASIGWDKAASHISAYASVHPWVDYTETAAHCLHMTDAQETAALRGLTNAIDSQPFGMAARRGPLSILMNEMYRSLGQDDLISVCHPPRAGRGDTGLLRPMDPPVPDL